MVHKVRKILNSTKKNFSLALQLLQLLQLKTKHPKCEK